MARDLIITRETPEGGVEFRAGNRASGWSPEYPDAQHFTTMAAASRVLRKLGDAAVEAGESFAGHVVEHYGFDMEYAPLSVKVGTPATRRID